MTERILSKVEDYLVNFVEKPHPTFSNLPVCPFAKKARLNKTINYVIHDFCDHEGLKNLIKQFRESSYEGLFLLHSTENIDNYDLEVIVDRLTKDYDLELQIFAFHPKSNFMMGGIHTRRMAHPGIIVQRDTDVLERELLLKKTKWYDKIQIVCERNSLDGCFYLKDCNKKGQGLFTDKSWIVGEILFKLSGEIKKDASELAIQISDDTFIESHPFFNDYLMNHSCNPNCSMVFCGDCFFVQALRNIEKNEELTWDYETTEKNMVYWKCDFLCSCGNFNCRKHIKGSVHRDHFTNWERAKLSR